MSPLKFVALNGKQEAGIGTIQIMCNNSKHIILSESDFLQISWCRGCNSFSMVYKCCCLSFTLSEIRKFHGIVKDVKQEDFIYTFMGEKHAVIKDKFSYMGLSLSEHDKHNIDNGICQALAVYELYEMLYQQ